jgi:dihydroflavonol-4-reductase
MRALVTGANGFTGSHLVKSLPKQGYQVKGLVRKSSNLQRLSDLNIDLVYGDITELETLEKAFLDVDTVFHTAAYVELGLVDEKEMERVNLEGTRTVLTAAKNSGIKKLVYCSTIGVFGDTKGKIVDETFVREETRFTSAYDRTKYQAQQLVDEFAKEGLPVVSVLPSGIFGEDDPHFGPIIKLFVEGKLKFWVAGDRYTGIVHVDDLVEAMILAATKGKVGEHYIISTGELKTRDMFAILAKNTGRELPREIPEPLVRVLGNVFDVLGRLFSWNPPISRERVYYLYDRCVRVDANKARQELGWQPRSLEETILTKKAIA